MVYRQQIIEELEKMTPEERQKTILHTMGGKGITGDELLDTLKGKPSLGVDNPGLIPKEERLKKLRVVF